MDDDERTFDCHGDKNTLGLRWKRWLTVFERFADGKGLILNEDNANNRQETCVNALSCGSRSSRYFPYRTQEIWRITGKRSLHWTHTSLSKSTLSMLDIVSDSLFKHQGKQSDSLQPVSDEHPKIVTMAKAQITKFVMKSSASAPACT